MKRFTLYVIALLLIDAGIFYQLGRQDKLNEMRLQYPHFYNLKRKGVGEGNCCPYEVDDIWITDSAKVHQYTETGWKKLN